MVNGMPGIYTRQGDGGQTGLLYGGRIDKDDLRCEAYGTTDEVISVLGLARASTADTEVADLILAVQRQLFVVGSELATSHEDYETFLKRANDLDPDMSILIEHTPQDKILDARDYIRETASRIGIPID